MSSCLPGTQKRLHYKVLKKNKRTKFPNPKFMGLFRFIVANIFFNHWEYSPSSFSLYPYYLSQTWGLCGSHCTLSTGATHPSSHWTAMEGPAPCQAMLGARKEHYNDRCLLFNYDHNVDELADIYLMTTSGLRLHHLSLLAEHFY